jgi:hypothetical protein
MISRVLGILASLSLALPIVAPRAALAQSSDEQYKAKREQITKDIDKAKKDLADAKGQRAQLEARLENLIAARMQERAEALLLSNETTALQQLDALLSTSQTNLLAQKDRFATLSDAVNSRTGATLVVLLRADSSQAQTIQSAVVTVDSVPGDTHTYTEKASGAVARGAVDQVFRSPVVPSDHSVAIQVTVNGRPLTATTKAAVGRQAVTYVQFAVRNGQVTSTSWTSQLEQ